MQIQTYTEYLEMTNAAQHQQISKMFDDIAVLGEQLRQSQDDVRRLSDIQDEHDNYMDSLQESHEENMRRIQNINDAQAQRIQELESQFAGDDIKPNQFLRGEYLERALKRIKTAYESPTKMTKITAIGLLRSVGDYGLKEAKRIVEGWD